jgi:hypothetical protein
VCFFFHVFFHNQGSFNWRLTFTIIGADPQRDLVWPGQHDSPVRTPVMPGNPYPQEMDKEEQEVEATGSGRMSKERIMKRRRGRMNRNHVDTSSFSSWLLLLGFLASWLLLGFFFFLN